MQCTYGGVRLSRTLPLARWFWARDSSTKLFVGGLSYDTNEAVLSDAFGQHGEIIEVKVICDHVSGRSKGYGFVRFTSEMSATTALKEMDGQVSYDHPPHLKVASPKTPSFPIGNEKVDTIEGGVDRYFSAACCKLPSCYKILPNVFQDGEASNKQEADAFLSF